MEKSLLLLYLGICSLQDIRKKEISAGLLFGGLGIAVMYNVFFLPFDRMALLTGIFPGLCLLLFSRLSEEAFGYGDGMIILIIGLVEGIEVTLGVFWLSLLLSAGFSLFCLLKKKCKRTSTYPFVPFLLLAWIVVWMGGFS